MMATIIAQPAAAPKPAARKPTRPTTSLHPTVGRASVSGSDVSLTRRRGNSNAPSPSPAPHHKPSQSSSNLRVSGHALDMAYSY
jgi:dynactin 1